MSRHSVIQHIEPGKPQQNAYVERYNRTVRHEWLDQYMFATNGDSNSARMKVQRQDTARQPIRNHRYGPPTPAR